MAPARRRRARARRSRRGGRGRARGAAAPPARRDGRVSPQRLSRGERPREGSGPSPRALRPGDAADPDALTSLGMAQARTGDTAAALATFGRILERDPTNALALVNVGTVRLMTGDRDVARQAFEAALDFDDLARAHNALGVIAAREGRWDEAIERWRRAAALDPRDYQALFNLGRTLRGAGGRTRRGRSSSGTSARLRRRSRRPTSRACARGSPRRRRAEGQGPGATAAGYGAARRCARASVSRPCG
ncbi:MAG: tetratricopeptide repeat protein [Vicinamibacteria bacterium]